MASFHAGRPALGPQVGPSTASASDADELLAPVMAGAYARGMAETLDLLGMPALFLDRSGEVIFASRAAAPLLGGRLSLHMRHLVAEGAGDNRALAAFIADAVGDARNADAIRLSGAALELRRLPRTEGSALPGQMVRAVILVADGTDPRHRAMLNLLA